MIELVNEPNLKLIDCDIDVSSEYDYTCIWFSSFIKYFYCYVSSSTYYNFV